MAKSLRGPATRARRTLVGGLASAALVLGAAAPAAASEPDGPAFADDVPCGSFRPDDPVRHAVSDSEPLDRLEVEAAHRAVRRIGGVGPGAGVRVAVLDSGVTTGSAIDVAGAQRFSDVPELVDAHGTIVAGLIAGKPRPAGGGPVGVAPEATIVDIRVFDASRSDRPEQQPPTTRTVARGLQAVLDLADPVDIVNVSIGLPDDPEIKRLVGELWRAGVIVVAASGNRPRDGDRLFDELGVAKAGEDASGLIFPAGYDDHVLAVSASADGVPGGDVRSEVLRNSSIDVAAPTFGGVSVDLNGSTCTLGESVATSWAAATVSGVLALLISAYPDESPAQIVARLISTADGRDDVRSPLVGAGVVQPLEALTRPVLLTEDGTLSGTTIPQRIARAEAPEPRPDVLAETRSKAVWWGLAGGGALILALVLRPLVARRSG